MRAKFINEIKQNKETSGLRTIGVGSVSLSKAFTEACKMDVHIENTLPLEYWDEFTDGVKDFKKIISECLEVPATKIGLQRSSDFSLGVKEYFKSLLFPGALLPKTSNIKIQQFELYWENTKLTTRLRTYTNKEMGLLYAVYEDDIGAYTHKYYCFRM